VISNVWVIVPNECLGVCANLHCFIHRNSLQMNHFTSLHCFIDRQCYGFTPTCTKPQGRNVIKRLFIYFLVVVKRLFSGEE
jgi:hypothetical protein